MFCEKLEKLLMAREGQEGSPEEWKLSSECGRESVPGKGNSVCKDLEVGSSVARSKSGRKSSWPEQGA